MRRLEQNLLFQIPEAALSPGMLVIVNTGSRIVGTTRDHTCLSFLAGNAFKEISESLSGPTATKLGLTGHQRSAPIFNRNRAEE